MSIRKKTKGAFGRTSRSRLNGLGLEILENRRLLAAVPVTGDFQEIHDNWNFRGEAGTLYALDSQAGAFEATENSDRFALRWVDPDGDVVHFNYAGEGTVTFELQDASQVNVDVAGSSTTMFQGNMDISIGDTDSFSSLQILTNPSGFGMTTSEITAGTNDGLADLKLILFNDNTGPLNFGNLQAAQAEFNADSGNVGILGPDTSLAATGLLRVGDVSGSGTAVGNLNLATGAQNTWEIFGGTFDFTSGTPLNVNTSPGVTPFFASLGVTYPTGVTVDADPQTMRDNLPFGARAVQLETDFSIDATTTQDELDDFFLGFTFKDAVEVTVDGDPNKSLQIGGLTPTDNTTTFQGGLNITDTVGGGLADTVIAADFNNTGLNVDSDVNNVDVLLQNQRNIPVNLESFTLLGNAVDLGIMPDPNYNLSITPEGVGDITINGTDHKNVSVASHRIGNVAITGNVASDGSSRGLSLVTDGPPPPPGPTPPSVPPSVGNVTVNGNVDDITVQSGRNIGNVEITGNVTPTNFNLANAGFNVHPGNRAGNITIGGTFVTIPGGSNIDFDEGDVDQLSIGTVDDSAGTLTVITKGSDINGVDIGKGDTTFNLDDAGRIGDITLSDGIATLDQPVGNIADRLGLVTANTVELDTDLLFANRFNGLQATGDGQNLNVDQDITVNVGGLGRISHSGDNADINIANTIASVDVTVRNGDFGEISTTGTDSDINITDNSVIDVQNGGLGQISTTGNFSTIEVDTSKVSVTNGDLTAITTGGNSSGIDVTDSTISVTNGNLGEITTGGIGSGIAVADSQIDVLDGGIGIINTAASSSDIDIERSNLLVGPGGIGSISTSGDSSKLSIVDNSTIDVENGGIGSISTSGDSSNLSIVDNSTIDVENGDIGSVTTAGVDSAILVSESDIVVQNGDLTEIKTTGTSVGPTNSGITITKSSSVDIQNGGIDEISTLGNSSGIEISGVSSVQVSDDIKSVATSGSNSGITIDGKSELVSTDGSIGAITTSGSGSGITVNDASKVTAVNGAINELSTAGDSSGIAITDNSLLAAETGIDSITTVGNNSGITVDEFSKVTVNNGDMDEISTLGDGSGIAITDNSEVNVANGIGEITRDPATGDITGLTGGITTAGINAPIEVNDSKLIVQNGDISQIVTTGIAPVGATNSGITITTNAIVEVQDGDIGEISTLGSVSDISIINGSSVTIGTAGPPVVEGNLGEISTSGRASDINFTNGNLSVNGDITTISTADGALIGDANDTTDDVRAHTIGEISATVISTDVSRNSDATVQGLRVISAGPDNADPLAPNPTLGTIDSIALVNERSGEAVFGDGLSTINAAGDIDSIRLVASNTDGDIIGAENTKLGIAAGGAYIGAGDDGTGRAVAQGPSNVTIDSIYIAGDFNYRDKATGGAAGPFGTNKANEGLIITAGFRPVSGAVMDFDASNVLQRAGERTLYTEDGIEKQVNGIINELDIKNLARETNIANVGSLHQTSAIDIPNYSDGDVTSPVGIPAIVANEILEVNGDSSMSNSEAIRFGEDNGTGNQQDINTDNSDWADFLVVTI